MLESITAWIGLVVAPALFGTIIYFLHDYKTKTEDKFTRLEALIDELSKEQKTNIQTMKHDIDIVINDSAKSLMLGEYVQMKKTLDRIESELSFIKDDIKNNFKFIQRHEKALASVYMLIKSHNNRIQDIYKTLRKNEIN